MNARYGLTRQINRRLLLALVLAMVFSAGVGVWVFHESNQRAAEVRLATLGAHLVGTLSQQENVWGREAYNYRARLEYSRLLENPVNRASRLVGYLTAQGGSPAFPYVRVLDSDKRIIAAYAYGRTELPPVEFPSGVDAVWLWDEAEKTLFRVFEQHVWLGSGNGHLQLYAPVDHALLNAIGAPEANTVVFWGEVPVASSHGHDGIAAARQRAAVADSFQRWLPWGDVALPTPRLLILPDETRAFAPGDLAIPLFFATLAFALVAWVTLGRWSVLSLGRVQAIRSAQEQFAEDRSVDAAVLDALEKAHGGIEDEIADVADTLQMMMNTIVSAESAEIDARHALMQSERRFRLLIEGTHAIAWEYDPQRDVFDYISPQAEAMLGYPLSAWSEPNLFARLLPPAGREAVLAERRRMFAANRQGAMEYRALRRDGQEIWLQDLTSPLLDEAGAIVKILGLTLDISERRQAEAQRVLSDLVVRHTGEGIIVTDADNRIISVNPAFERITGYRRDEVLGKNPRLLQSGLQDAALYQQMWQSLEQAGAWSGELWNRRRDGEIYAQRVSIVTIPGEHELSARYIALFSDVTVEKHQAEELAYQAAHDPLTGLPNRRLLGDRMDSALARARRDNTHVGVLILDLDGFKHINDTLGHVVGDQVLVDVARRLQHSLRETDTLARVGGDEFMLLVEGVADQGDLQPIASKVLERIQEPFVVEDSELYLTTSIGIAVFPEDGATMGKLFANADTALYRAKGEGRNAFRFFTAEMHAAALARMEIEHELRRAIPNSEFVLHYQPVIELASGRVAKAEALVRWQHPERGLVPPVEFIPVAEDTGLILPLGTWIVGEAVRQSAAWAGDCPPGFKICVNFSVHQFHRSDPIALLAETLAASGQDSGTIVVEVTESLFMEDDGNSLAQLHALRERGFEIAIDDFGTGYSSLSYLQRLPVDTLKIDRSFVSGIPDNPKSIALIDVMLSLGRTFGIAVIAEGIETETQARFLRERGCAYGQGYYFGKPVPAADFARDYLDSPETR